MKAKKPMRINKLALATIASAALHGSFHGLRSVQFDVAVA